MDDAALTVTRLHRTLEHTQLAELSIPQFRVLGLLAAGGSRASAIAARLAVTRPTVTSLIDTLDERGFVERTAVAGDRRAMSLSITPAGRAAVAAASVALGATLDEIVDRCADPSAVRAALTQLGPALDGWFHDRLQPQGATA